MFLSWYDSFDPNFNQQLLLGLHLDRGLHKVGLIILT